jgi:hypothetical protein
MGSLLALLVFGVFVFMLVSFLTYTNINNLLKAQLTSSDLIIPQETAEWASANSFEYIKSFVMRFHSSQADIWAWRRKDRPTFFCRYMVKVGNTTKVAYDIVTEFAGNIGLTTGCTKDANFMPRPPNFYFQNFPGTMLNDLWYKHIEAENYLMDFGKTELKAERLEFEQSIMQGTIEHVRYIKTLSLWPFRGPYWYFVRWYLWHNKSIKEQYEKGMIKLPNEFTERDKEVVMRIKVADDK